MREPGWCAAEGRVNSGRGGRKEKRLLPVKPLHLLVDGRENPQHTTKPSPPRRFLLCYLAEMKTPRRREAVFRSGVGRWCWVAEHPSAAGTAACRGAKPGVSAQPGKNDLDGSGKEAKSPQCDPRPAGCFLNELHYTHN